MSKIGYCKYCGQSFAVEDSVENPDICATLHCKCDEAMKYKHKVQQRKDAELMVNNYVGEDAPIKKLLMDMVDSLQEQTALSFNIRVTKRVKLALSITGDGEIKIRRTITDTDEDRV